MMKFKHIPFWVLLIFFACSHQKSTIKQNNHQKIIKPRKITAPIKAPQKKKKKAEKEITITMNFQDARLSDVLKIIAGEFKVNLVVPPDNKSRVTAYLYKANLTKALDIILSSLDYSYFIKDKTYFILKNSEKVHRVYRLKYAKAHEVRQILEGMSDTGHIKSDELTNSVVVTDIVGNMRAYDEIIASLDSFQPSVMIEAELFEVSLNRLQNLGLEWNITHNANKHEFYGKTPYSTGATTNLFLNYKTLKLPQVELILNALRNDTETRLLSSPRIVTMNGQEAKILVGERVPYVKMETATAAGNVMQEVEFVDVGILLRVTPRIVLEEGIIFIDVQPEVSEVLNMDVQGVPRIGTREAKTRIAVKDGETAIIGGLIKRDKVKTASTLPILGKIPVLNWFFKNQENTQIDRELIVFITPHILTREYYEQMDSQNEYLKMKKEWEIQPHLFP